MELSQGLSRHLDQVVAWCWRCLRRASRDASGQMGHVADVQARGVPFLVSLVEVFQRDLGNVVFQDLAVQAFVGFVQLGRQALPIRWAQQRGVIGRDYGQQVRRRRDLLEHYGLRATRINRGKSHENGVAEHAHYRLKDAVDQALILRGSRDFHTADDYAGFVRKMVEKRNRLLNGKLEQEMACLRPLPPAPMPEYANYQSKVRRWSTIQVAGRSYSVPSRLIGKVVQTRLYSDHVEVYYKGHFVERMARVHGDGEVNVNYRHVINSLVRKPGAFARYRFREQLFPTLHFRLAYDALKQWRGERADVEYVRILHLAATTMEANVDSALSLLLETGQHFDYGEVRELAEPKPPQAPALVLSGKPDLKIYDGLLTVSLATAGVCA